ncbi:MAG: 8-oxo-dGTP diphosphatase [Patescibacteria group bacterium]|jgi:8-oxo-dGTP diphosphatase
MEKTKPFNSYEKISVTIDLVIFSFIKDKLSILLAKRINEPYKGQYGLPGGFVQVGENLEETIKRKLKEEVGDDNIYFEQLYTWGDKDRDQRGRVITISYFALVNQDNIALNEKDVKWFPVEENMKLPFDHKQIIEYAIKRLKWKFEYTPLACSLLPKEFPITALRKLYTTVFEKEFDKRNFNKKILSNKIFEEIGIQKDVPNRPAKLYKLKTDSPEFVSMI